MRQKPFEICTDWVFSFSLHAACQIFILYLLELKEKRKYLMKSTCKNKSK